MRIPHDHEEKDNPELKAPPELVSALKQLPQENLFIPRSVDEAVFRAAHQHVGTIQSTRTGRSGQALLEEIQRQLARWKTGLAAGFAAIVVALLAYHFFPSSPTRNLERGESRREFAAMKPLSEGTAPAPAPIQDNLNQGKGLDILDAFHLAKRLQTGAVRETQWDLNHDGVVDERDVQAIAAQAVRLDKGGRS